MPDMGLIITSFVAVSSLILLAFLLLDRRKGSIDGRLGSLAAAHPSPLLAAHDEHAAAERKSIDWLERRTARRLEQESRQEGLRERMTQAGFYQPHAGQIFLAARFLLLIVPVAGGWVTARTGLLPPAQGIILGLVVGLAGTLAPSVWLDRLKQSRQTKIRRALPDAFDVMTVCLRGGLSLAGTFSRVAHELAVAHPMLAVEFHILERQVQMGRTTGEAVRELSRRFDLEELRSMASVIIQTERLGSSIVAAFEVFSETLRQKRQQRAEEMAQKASVKLLFPTLFFIFPGIFIVILGPAAIQIYRMFAHGIVQ
jgi:tight adherence protein C